MTELTSVSATTYGAVVAPNRYHGVILKLLAGILLVGAVLASQPVLAEARVVDCRRAVTPNITISSARNMSCIQAMRDMRRYHGSIDRASPRPAGSAATGSLAASSAANGAVRAVSAPTASTSATDCQIGSALPEHGDDGWPT